MVENLRKPSPNFWKEPSIRCIRHFAFWKLPESKAPHRPTYPRITGDSSVLKGFNILLSGTFPFNLTETTRSKYMWTRAHD